MYGMEVKTEVRPYKVEKLCEVCQKGKMLPTGSVFTMNPPLYQHRCDGPKCGHTSSYNKAYPVIEYHAVNETPVQA